MLCSGISVSLLVYKSPFPQDKRGKKPSKGCSGETSMRGNLYCKRCALMLETDTWHRLSLCFWPSDHVSAVLSSVGISSGVMRHINVSNASQSLNMREGICFKCCGVAQQQEHSFTLLTCTLGQNQRKENEMF